MLEYYKTAKATLRREMIYSGTSALHFKHTGRFEKKMFKCACVVSVETEGRAEDDSYRCDRQENQSDKSSDRQLEHTHTENVCECVGYIEPRVFMDGNIA